MRADMLGEVLNVLEKGELSLSLRNEEAEMDRLREALKIFEELGSPLDGKAVLVQLAEALPERLWEVLDVRMVLNLSEELRLPLNEEDAVADELAEGV